MSPFGVAAAAAGGLVLGHLVRRATPRLAGVRSQGLPFRWPWVEISAGSVFAITVAVAPAPPWPWLLFALALVAIAATDFFAKLIPDRVTFPGALAGIVCSAVAWEPVTGWLNHGALLDAAGLAAGPLGGALLGALGALVGFGVLEGFRRVVGLAVGMEVLGMGDSKLLMLLGAFLGPSMVLLSLVPALAAGLLLGIAYTRLARTPHLPFGPALAIGGWVTLLLDRRILEAWVGLGAALNALPPVASLLVTLALLVVAVLLLLRVRRRRAEYTRRIEEEYDRLEER